MINWTVSCGYPVRIRFLDIHRDKLKLAEAVIQFNLICDYPASDHSRKVEF